MDLLAEYKDVQVRPVLKTEVSLKKKRREDQITVNIKYCADYFSIIIRTTFFLLTWHYLIPTSIALGSYN